MRLLSFLLLAACSDYKFTSAEKEAEGVDTAPPPEDTAPPPPEDTGEPIDIRKDVWDLSENAGVDIVFFGDTSGSMKVELQTMASQVTTFVERLATYTDQWQLMAVTGPTGCGVNGILTPEISNYAELFSTGIITPPGADDVDEWGLNNSMQAVLESDVGGCNEGFMRDGARLHVIFISDEDDNSPGFDGGDDTYWQTYTDAIVAAKGSADEVTFSGVIGPVPDGCAGAEPGRGYADAIEAYSGELLSICEEWQESIDLLVDASVAWPIYSLTAIPEPDTIEVMVNGSQRTDGWSYLSLNNTILFTDNVPTLGDMVVVTYQEPS